MDEWWILLIILGVIFLISIGILIWIIVVSNKLVVLKNAVDRNFPVINSKIKQYCAKVDEFVKYVERRERKKGKDGQTLKKEAESCLSKEGMLDRAISQKELSSHVNRYIGAKNKKKVFKTSKKMTVLTKELEELQKQLNSSIEKYNNCVEKYNKLRTSFPSKIISERFKFYEKNKWEI